MTKGEKSSSLSKDFISYWAEVYKPFSEFLEENHDLLILVAVFGAFTAYLTTIEIPADENSFLYLGVIAGFCIVTIICFIILANAVIQIIASGDLLLSKSNFLLVLFVFLFYILVGSIMTMLVLFGNVGAIFLVYVVVFIAIITLIDIARIIYQSAASGILSDLPYSSEFRIQIGAWFLIYISTSAILYLYNPDRLQDVTSTFDRELVIFLIIMLILLWWVVSVAVLLRHLIRLLISEILSLGRWIMRRLNFLHSIK